MNLTTPYHGLRPHHAEALAAFVERVRNDESVVAVILGGSLVKGTSRPDSDVDLVLVVTPERYAELSAAAKLVTVDRIGIAYEGGYYDIKHVSRAVLELSAERGSEPTRNAYVGARVVETRDPELEGIVSRIGVYPEHERQDRITTFHAGLCLNRYYFWGEARKRGDRYLLMRSAADTVMYGLRMVLAYNRVLFPCHKWLTKAVDDCAETPPGILALADALLTEMRDEDMVTFVDAVRNWRDWQIEGDVLSRYVRDHEQWWQFGGPYVSEW